MYLDLAKRWARGTAILFAVGAVSGTVLSFELGLLWPKFMEVAGPLIGMPFSLEGFAFFLEAIFLGVYLYGWDRVSPRAHLLAGILVAVSGAASGIFVVIANAWMNTPTGFAIVVLSTDIASPVHVLAAVVIGASAYAATGVALAFVIRGDLEGSFVIILLFMFDAFIAGPLGGADGFWPNLFPLHHPSELVIDAALNADVEAGRYLWSVGYTVLCVGIAVAVHKRRFE